MQRAMKELVAVQGDFMPSVQLPADFFDPKHNRHFVSSYIPTEETTGIMMRLRASLQQNSDQRARQFVGTFGTGKSDLMLLMANYLTRDPDDEIMQTFFEKLYRLDADVADALHKARKDKPPFLLVLLQADTARTFSSFILDGLSRALEAPMLGELLGTTYYKAALDQIRLWEEKMPDHIDKLEDILEANYQTNIEELKEDLAGPHADGALTIFRDAVDQALFMPFAPNHVIERPSDAFVDVAKKLRESGRYSGVFIIVDEFTNLMRRLGQDPGAADSKAIDNLAAEAVRSGSSQIHFYVVSLESFAAAHGSTMTSQAELEKSGGRFLETELRSQNSEELIRASIGKLRPVEQLFDGHQDEEDDLLDVAMRLWGSRAIGKLDKGWLLSAVVRGCFPLHPLVMYCLPRLNAELAQNERTMFRFIWDRDRGLNKFIEETHWEEVTGNWIPLLSLERLFTYFEDALKVKRADLFYAYDRAYSSLPADQLHGLEGRLLRAIVMLEVASGLPGLQADADLLRHAVGLPRARKGDVEAALDNLVIANIAIPTGSGYYQLLMSGRVNPMEMQNLIEKSAQDMSGSIVDLLNMRSPLNDIEATTYNDQKGTSRHLAAKFMTVESLDSTAMLSALLKGRDGVACYVLASSDQGLARAQPLAARLTRENEQLVVAVPREPSDLLMKFRLAEALRDFQKRDEYQSPDYKALLRDDGLVGRKYAQGFKEARDLFNKPGKLVWYRRGQVVIANRADDLQNVATAVMRDVFPNTPKHNTRQHIEPDSRQKPAIKKALEAILTGGIQIPAHTKTRSAYEVALLDGAASMGLIGKIDTTGGYDVYAAKEPPPGTAYQDSRAVWALIDSYLRRDSPWVEIVSLLMGPPYGMYTSQLQLFVAAFYRCNRDYIEVYRVDKGVAQVIDVYASIIAEMVNQPASFLIQYTPLTNRQRDFLRDLSGRILYDVDVSGGLGDSVSLRNRVAMELRTWAGALPVAARSASPEELDLIVPAYSDEVRSARLALLRTAMMHPEVAETGSAILKEFPEELGLPTDSSLWDDTSLSQAITYLETARVELQSFASAFANYVSEQVARCFGIELLPADRNSVLYVAQEWRRIAVGKVHITDLSTNRDAKDLLSVLDDDPHGFEQVFLDALPSRFGLKPQPGWQSIKTCEEYITRLQDVKANVEAKAAELGPAPPLTPPPPMPRPQSVVTVGGAGSSGSATTVQPDPANNIGVTTAPMPGVESTSPVTPMTPPMPVSSGNGKAAEKPGSAPARAAAHRVEEAAAKVEVILADLTSDERTDLLRRLADKYGLK